MRRLWAASAAMMACLALGAPVMAQEHTLVTGTQECPTFVEGTTSVVEGVERSRGYEFGCTFTLDDPRVSGDFSAQGDSDCTFDPATQAYSCLGRSYAGVLMGPEGTWVGGSVGVDNTYVGFFEGTGAYEGLTFAAHSLENGDIQGCHLRGIATPSSLGAPGFPESE